MKKYKTLKDFYPYYLTEHQNKMSRNLHYIGTTLFILTIIYALWTGKYNWLFIAPVFGYGFAWVGHYFFEKNKPATFKYPLFSLASDFVMYYHKLIGKEDEMQAAAKEKIIQ
jgi:hypothetical protein